MIQKDRLLVWDPEADTVVLRLDGAFAVASFRRTVAWCDGGCPELHVTDAATGRDKSVASPEKYEFVETYGGAFSPDGGMLAVPVKNAEGGAVAMVDVSDASAEVVPGSTLTDYELIEWSATGEWLIFVNEDGDLHIFHPVTSEAFTIDLEPSQTFFAMATS